MFSVNIDKLVTMTDAQLAAYKKIASGLAGEFNKKAVAIYGNPVVAFKIAAKVAETGKKVAFIDCDVTKSAFIGKYKLGKELGGVCEYVAGEKEAKDIICKTNNENLKLVFTGNVEEKSVDMSSEAVNRLIKDFLAEDEIVVIAAGSDANVAKKCDGVVVVADGAEYSEEETHKLVDDLMAKGCECAGVILENC